jgi:hypothetical protein
MSDTEKKKLEVVFAPGCFDDFEGSQEELDDLVAEISRLVESGEMFEQEGSMVLSDMDLSDEELEELLIDLEEEDDEKSIRSVH